MSKNENEKDITKEFKPVIAMMSKMGSIQESMQPLSKDDVSDIKSKYVESIFNSFRLAVFAEDSEIVRTSKVKFKTTNCKIKKSYLNIRHIKDNVEHEFIISVLAIMKKKKTILIVDDIFVTESVYPNTLGNSYTFLRDCGVTMYRDMLTYSPMGKNKILQKINNDEKLVNNLSAYVLKQTIERKNDMRKKEKETNKKIEARKAQFYNSIGLNKIDGAVQEDTKDKTEKSINSSICVEDTERENLQQEKNNHENVPVKANYMTVNIIYDELVGLIFDQHTSISTLSKTKFVTNSGRTIKKILLAITNPETITELSYIVSVVIMKKKRKVEIYVDDILYSNVKELEELQHNSYAAKSPVYKNAVLQKINYNDKVLALFASYVSGIVPTKHIPGRETKFKPLPTSTQEELES